MTPSQRQVIRIQDKKALEDMEPSQQEEKKSLVAPANMKQRRSFS